MCGGGGCQDSICRRGCGGARGCLSLGVGWSLGRPAQPGPRGARLCAAAPGRGIEPVSTAGVLVGLQTQNLRLAAPLPETRGVKESKPGTMARGGRPPRPTPNLYSGVRGACGSVRARPCACARVCRTRVLGTHLKRPSANRGYTPPWGRDDGERLSVFGWVSPSTLHPMASPANDDADLGGLSPPRLHQRELGGLSGRVGAKEAGVRRESRGELAD